MHVSDAMLLKRLKLTGTNKIMGVIIGALYVQLTTLVQSYGIMENANSLIIDDTTDTVPNDLRLIRRISIINILSSLNHRY